MTLNPRSMKRPSAFDKKLERLRELRRLPAEQAAKELREFLAAKQPYLVAKAAEAIGELELQGLGAELSGAFERLLAGDQPDSGCIAIAKVVEALGKLEVHAPEAYLRGLRLVRMEASGPGFIDTAVSVRIECAHALMTIHHPHALFEVTPLLADPEAAVRAGGAHTIARSPADGAAAVLQLKLLIGDPEPEVLGACMAGLLASAPERFVPVVGDYLDGEDLGLAELAAIALGESHRPDAVEVLVGALERQAPSSLSASILLALALARSDRAQEQLFAVLEGHDERFAEQALTALAVLRHRPGVEERVKAAVERKRSAKLRALMREKFK
ncbi:MAG: HEAT repeat domain-containing protein [Myxococcaceae bacterium]